MLLYTYCKLLTDFKSAKLFALFVFALFFFKTNKLSAQTSPTGFSTPLFMNGWNELEGFRYDSKGQMYVWEKAGRVWVVDTNGVRLPNALLDIHEEVGGWRDHGLNGFALDPNFRTNGYYYLFYTVDRNYLLYFGKPQYVAAADSFYNATIARVTRYTADPATNFTTTIAGSRLVLLGEDKKTGVPVLHESHSGGELVFGTDGSLLVSTGDGASYNFADSGGTVTTGTYWQRALADTIIRDKENVGAFRSQLVDCLNGKILRINPANGDGLPTNPYYDAANPRAAKSRVWCLGLRNPFRMVLRPGTGSTDITAGKPGVLYIGDVGWSTWEDLNVATAPALNFGWPLYEGLTPQTSYQNIVNQFNKDAPNPLYGTGGCTEQFFKFKELLIQANLAPSFPNACNAAQQVPANIPHFIHARPAVDWSHSQAVARTGIYNGNNAAEINLNAGGSPVPGPVFNGNASVGGVWYTGTKYPVAYQNKYYQSDYGQGWIRTFNFNSANNPVSVDSFGTGYGAVVFLEYNPKDQFIYYVKYPSEIYKLSYNLTVNNPPVAVASQNKVYGASPLSINFTGSNSTDPENQPLTYLWDFGDGTATSSSQNPSHVFNAAAGVPTTYTVTLTVTDNASQTSTATLKVYVNNTPPQVSIISFNDGDLYSMAHNTILPLQANVTDAEHSAAQLTYAWQTFLHHNNHEHEEAIDNNVITSTVITPVGCDTPNVYFFRIVLTVTDAGGLSTTVEKRVYPACDAPVADFIADNVIGCPGLQVNFTDKSTSLPEAWSWLFPGGNPSSSTLKNPTVSYAVHGTYDVILTSSNIRGNDAITKTGYILINPVPHALVTPDGIDSVCYGTSVLMTANNGGSLIHQWMKNNIDIVGATSYSYTANTIGTFKVKVTNSSTGCYKISAATKIVTRNSPDVTLTTSGPVTFCAGDSVILSVPNVTGNTYQWQKGGVNINGAVSFHYTAKSTAKLKVIVTDQFGCSKTSVSTQVTVNCRIADGSNENNLLHAFNASIYPNPLNNKDAILTVTMQDDGLLTVKIFDAIGKQVQIIADKLLVKEGENEIKVDAAAMSPGIYFVQVGNGLETRVIKMVVNNLQ